METKKIDLKGIAWFLGITFIPTIGISLFFWSRSLTVKDSVVPLALAGMMFLPAISAFIVRKFITKEGFADAGLKWGSWRPYLFIWGVIPLYFLLLHIVTAVFVSPPDFTIVKFMEMAGMPETELPLSPTLMLLAVFAASLFLSPIFNFIPSFGEEFGWRGYLLPKLLPLGEGKALLLSGFIWGLWHLPFIILLGFGYGDDSLRGSILFVLLVTALGIIIGYFQIVYGSTYLAAFMHGTFNAQSYGVWVMLFPDINPLIGGSAGIIAVAILILPAIAILKKLEPENPT